MSSSEPHRPSTILERPYTGATPPRRPPPPPPGQPPAAVPKATPADLPTAPPSKTRVEEDVEARSDAVSSLEDGRRPEATYAQARPSARVQLPSKGRFYGGKVPDGSVEVLYLTAREDKILSALDGTNTQRLFDMVLARCLRSPISPADLLSTDHYYLMLVLRAQALGEEVEWIYRCPRPCGKETPQRHRVPADFPVVDGTAQTEPFSVEISGGRKVSLRLLRASDSRAIEDYRAKMRKAAGGDSEPGDPAWGYASARQIVDLDGTAFKNAEAAAAWFMDLQMADSRAITRACDLATPGVSNSVTAVCGACGRESPGESVPLPAAYFFG